MTSKDAHAAVSRRAFLRYAALSGGALLAACGSGAPAADTNTAPAAPATTVSGAATAPTADTAQSAAPTADTAQSAAPTAASATTGGATGAANKQYKGTIVVSVSGAGGNGFQSAFEGVKQAFTKHQPDVQLVAEGAGTGVDEPTWLGTQLAAGTPRPDIVSGNYQPTYANYINLDQYRFQTNPYTNQQWDKDLNWDLLQVRNAKGERYMLPTEAVHINWFYNKDLFQKAGVEPPKTWDDMAAVCEKLKAAGITPIASNFQWKLPQWVYEIYNDQYVRDRIQYVRAQPGDYNYDDEMDGKWKFTLDDRFAENKFNINPSRQYKAIQDKRIRFDTPQTTALVSNFKQVFPQYASSSLYVETTDYSEFLQQNVAMIIDGSWSLPGLTRDMQSLNSLSAERLKSLKIEDASRLKPFAWGTFENPPMTGDLIEADVRSIESAAGVYASVINKNAQQTEMAVDFLMFWYSQQGYQAYVDSGLKANKGYSPTGPIVINGIKLPDEIQKLFDGLTMMGNAENGYTMDTGIAVPELQTEAFNLFKNALDGKIPPEAYGQQLQKLYDANFPAILKAAGLTQANIDNPARPPQ